MVILKHQQFCPTEEAFCLPWGTPEGRASSRNGEEQEVVFNQNGEEVSRSARTPVAAGGTGTGARVPSLAGLQAKDMTCASQVPKEHVVRGTSKTGVPWAPLSEADGIMRKHTQTEHTQGTTARSLPEVRSTFLEAPGPGDSCPAAARLSWGPNAACPWRNAAGTG